MSARRIGVLFHLKRGHILRAHNVERGIRTGNYRLIILQLLNGFSAAPFRTARRLFIPKHLYTRPVEGKEGYSPTPGFDIPFIQCEGRVPTLGHFAYKALEKTSGEHLRQIYAGLWGLTPLNEGECREYAWWELPYSCLTRSPTILFLLSDAPGA
jgi:hypothetical protein